MRKLLLVVSMVSAAITSVNAQCTPGAAYPSANWADTAVSPGYGAWPDTVENFPGAYVNVPYSTDLSFMVPSTVNAAIAGGDPVAANFIGSPIVDFKVTGVTFTPAAPGLTYACNNNNTTCTYPGGSFGCANLSGTFTATGTYKIEIAISANLLIDAGALIGFPTGNYNTPFTYPTSFKGYKVVVGTLGTIEAIINPIEVYPNPASDKITINGLNSAMKINAVKITNMEGKVIKTVDVSSPSMEVSLNGVDNGIYFVVVEHANGTETVKFVKE
jgi:hypothetical protein